MSGPVALIVGGGQAGARAASALREAGFEGSIRILGEEAHLPYERPKLSKAMLLDPATPVPFALPLERYAALGIDVSRNTIVEAIDPAARTVTTMGGDILPYDILLLATGSRPRPLAVPGYPADRLFSLRTLDDARAIERLLAQPCDAAVIGGGFIGLETAASIAARGCRVTVLEAADRLLPRLGCAETSRIVLEYHRAAGIDIRLGVKVIGGGPDHLDLDDGMRLPARFAIAGIGVLPETRLAETAGLAVDDGILVDQYGRTSDPHIFAAGDVVRQYHPLLDRHVRLESWQNANLQAEAAGRAMAGVLAPVREEPWIWSDQGALNLQVVGVPERIDRIVTRGAPDGAEGVSLFQFASGRLVGGVTIARGKDMVMIRRMLGLGLALNAPEALADESLPLRQFLPRQAA